MPLVNIINELIQAKVSQDYVNVWDKYKDFLEENDAHLVFTQDNYTNPKLPKIDMFGSDTKRFKSLFQNNNFIFLNQNIIRDMNANKEPVIGIDYTVSFDTQFASFIERYFTGKSIEQLEEFENILYKLIDNNVNSDYIPYIFENVAKGESKEAIKSNIKQIINFFHLDKSSSYLLKNMKIKNQAQCDLNYEDIVKNTIDNTDYNELKDFQQQQEIMYIILMKIIIINKEKKSPKQKINELVSFMHNSIFTMFDRELTIAIKFYENQNELRFFNKVININAKTLTQLSNMAWDLALVRLLEQSYAIRPKVEADFFISYFLTFDEGLAQIIDCYPLKAILMLNKSETLQVISNVDKTKLVEKYKLEEYFSVEAHQFRNENREKGKENKRILQSDLEERIKEYAYKELKIPGTVYQKQKKI